MPRLQVLFPKESEISFLTGSLLLFVAAIASHYYFLQLDYFIQPKAKWETPAGYTKMQFVHLVIGTYFIPVAIILMSIYVSKSSKKTSYTSIYKLVTYTSLTQISLLGCAVSAYYAGEVLGCIGYFCMGSSEASSTSSGLITVNLVFFAICVYFSIIFMWATFTIGMAKCHESNTVSVANSTYYQIHNDMTSNTLTSNNLETLRAAEKSHRKAYKYSTLKELGLVALVFAVLYPIMILACTLLPTWWSDFTRFKIQKYQAQEPSKEYGFYWMLTLNDDVIMKLFPDIAIYFSAIYFVSLLGLSAQYWPPLKRFFHVRLTPTICLGQALLGFMLVALLAVSWFYWFRTHVYENNSNKIRTSAELAARSFGQIGNVVIGLLVLPVAKNGVWSKVFGVSWEGMIIYHKILGYTFLLIILSHMFSWWIVFSQKKSFPYDIFAVPMIYHKDNFTVPLSVLTSLFMFIIMGGLTFHLIRRKNYELFYYFHLFSGIIFLAVLWHATMSWYYMTAGLILYALDNAIRLSSTIATEVTLKDFTMAVKDSEFPSAPSSLSSSPSSTSALLPVDSTAEFFEVNSSSPSNGTGTGNGIGIGIGVDGSHTGVTKLSYTVLSKDRRSSHSLCHLMGQYVYINIPSISSLEWHPFTISSAPIDSVTTHHIKVMGGLNNGQWTAKLHKLAMKLQDDKVRAQAHTAHTAMHSVIDSNSVINPAHIGRRFLSVQGSDRGRGGERERGRETTRETAASNRVRDRDDNEEGKNQNQQHQQQQQGHGEGPGQGEREGEREGEKEALSLSSITVNIDGPYGLSVTHELHKYTHVLLIGGGIGVTPLHSCLRHLVLMKMCASTSHVEAQALADTEAGSGTGTGRGRNNLDHVSENLMPFPFPDLKSVELLWSVKKIEESYIFADTLNLVSSGLEGVDGKVQSMFSVCVHVTGFNQSLRQRLNESESESERLSDNSERQRQKQRQRQGQGQSESERIRGTVLDIDGSLESRIGKGSERGSEREIESGGDKGKRSNSNSNSNNNSNSNSKANSKSNSRTNSRTNSRSNSSSNLHTNGGTHQHTQHYPVKQGRPNVEGSIARIAAHGYRALVFVCGPAPMVAQAAALSMQYGVDFRHETFEL